MSESESLHDIVDQLEEGDEFQVFAGEFIVDEVIDMEARPYLRVRKKSVGGWMERTYRLEWVDPTDEDDETLVIKTRYKSHWSEWSTFDPEQVELEDGTSEIDVGAEESEPVLVTDGGVAKSENGLQENEEVAWEVNLCYSLFNESPSDETLTVAAPDRESAIEEAREVSRNNPPEVGPVYQCSEIPVDLCDNRGEA